MDIWHRISLNSKKDSRFFKVIRDLGIKYQSIELPGGNSSLISFEIRETDPNWDNVEVFIDTYKVTDIADTFFSEEEIRNATWLRLVSSFENGYPQPKSQWPIKQHTYKITCPECAIKEQTGSFRISGEPNLKGNSFMSLIWCADIFATQEVFSKFQNINATGYETWDILIQKIGKSSSKVKQLYVPTVAESGLLNNNRLGYVECKKCNTKKYYPHSKGVMILKRHSLPIGVDFALSFEWFGSGLVAYREIFISNRIAQLILDHQWQGVRLKVVELV